MARQCDIDDANKDENKSTASGIQWERSCTDMICCLLFIAFSFSLCGIVFIALGEGNPGLIVAPYDSAGNKCGPQVHADGHDFLLPEHLDKDFKNAVAFPEHKFVMYANLEDLLAQSASGNAPDLKALKIYASACVKECPKKDTTPECETNADVADCADLTSSLIDYEEQFGTCLPSPTQAGEKLVKMKDAFMQYNSGQFGAAVMELQGCWKAVAGMCAATVVIAVIYVALLKCLTKPLLYVSIALIAVGFALGAGLVFMHGQKFKNLKDEDGKNNNQYIYSMVGAGCIATMGLLYLCVICCCWKNIALGASIMEAASDFVSQNTRVALLPVASLVLSAVYLIFWVVAMAHLYSVGDVKFDKDSFTNSFVYHGYTYYMLWYFLFSLFWVVSFLISFEEFMIAAMTCQWYFSGQGEAMSDKPGEANVGLAFRWAAYYHCGSIAFGSFCIALVTMIRVVFEYITMQYEKVGNKENPVYKCLKCCIRCMLWCLDKYVKFISENAYIQIALRSKSFCTSAWESFYLVIRHAGRFGAAEMIGVIMSLIGKASIMATSAWLTIVVIKGSYPEVSQPLVPAIIVSIVAYVIGSIFLSVFSFSANTILHCFIADEDCGVKGNTPKSLEPFLEFNDNNNK